MKYYFEFHKGSKNLINFFFQKAFCWFPAFPGFRFLPESIFENTKTTENFHNFVVRDIKTIHLILTTFIVISCVQGTTRKVLLKFIMEHVLLLLGWGFSGYWSLNGSWIRSWLLFSSFPVTVTGKSGRFFI